MKTFTVVIVGLLSDGTPHYEDYTVHHHDKAMAGEIAKMRFTRMYGWTTGAKVKNIRQKE